MRHIEIRDLWLQKEVREGKVELSKIPGEENPADLMTKILTIGEIKEIGTIDFSEFKGDTPFMLWQQLHFAADSDDPTIAGPDADPSGDRVSNLLKYAFGLDPQVTSQDGVPTVEMTGDQVTLVFTRVPSATDLAYIAEWSTDLIDWQETEFTETMISATGDTERVAASVNSSSVVKCFFRIRVVIR